MATASTATNLLEFRTELPVAAERVFAALTEGDHLARWFCDAAVSVPAAGGRVSARWTRPGSSTQPFDGRWVVFQPPSACAYEGGHAGHPDGYAGRIGFELAARGGGTVLITRHRLPARPDYEPVLADYRSAWPRALERLVAYLNPEGAATIGVTEEPRGTSATQATEPPRETGPIGSTEDPAGPASSEPPPV